MSLKDNETRPETRQTGVSRNERAVDEAGRVNVGEYGRHPAAFSVAAVALQRGDSSDFRRSAGVDPRALGRGPLTATDEPFLPTPPVKMMPT